MTEIVETTSPNGHAPASRLPTSGRPRPAVSRDTRFFWDGAAEGRLLIQRCTACQTLRHPPGPACPRCQSFDWDTLESTGLGTVRSYTVLHHPKPAGFTEPAIVALVDLDEGTRILSNIDADPADVAIDARVSVFFLPQAEGWTVPQFRLVAP
jgi:uncharacterized OB-fold protein